MYANIYKGGNYPFASAPPSAFGPYGYQGTQLLYSVSEPITKQPLGPDGGATFNEVYLNPPQSIVNCLPGLEKLAAASELVVRQYEEILEVSPGFKTRSKFTVKNNFGQKIYYPFEDSAYANSCCGALKASDMIILDNSRKEVLHFHRPSGCDGCCFMDLQTMTVSASQGMILGTVEQKMSISYNFVVKNAGGDIVLRIVGPYSPCFSSMFDNVNFQIMSSCGSVPIGKITREWSSPCQSAYNFKITFPLDLDVGMKATLLGACFLIDAMVFETYE